MRMESDLSISNEVRIEVDEVVSLHGVSIIMICSYF
jgi:hypothetical protein